MSVSFDDFLSLAADEVAFDSLVTQVLRGGGISIINSNACLKNLIQLHFFSFLQ